MCMPLRLSSASTSVTFSPSKHGSRSRRAFNRSFLSISKSIHRHGGSLIAGVCVGSDINIFLSVSKSDTEREREKLWVSKNKDRYHKKDSCCLSSMAHRKFSVKKPKIINIATQERKRQDPYMNISPTSSSLFAPSNDFQNEKDFEESQSLVKEKIDKLVKILEQSNSILCVTGAGISTESGIPDYRGPKGSYSRGFQPMIHDQFISSEYQRARYWARSMVGFHKFGKAKPNSGHDAITDLMRLGKLNYLITQNVDGLHQQSGIKQDICMDLHGKIDDVICMNCKTLSSRAELQTRLHEKNINWIQNYLADTALFKEYADGDVDLGDVPYGDFQVPSCKNCGGVLKPDVTFFGDVVPKSKVQYAFQQVEQSDCMLVVGSSLFVYSGFRFVQAAHRQGIPICIVNYGPTRAEKENMNITVKTNQKAGEILPEVLRRLS